MTTQRHDNLFQAYKKKIELDKDYEEEKKCTFVRIL